MKKFSNLLFILFIFSHSACSDTNQLDTEMQNIKRKITTEKREWLGKTFLEAQDKLGAFFNEDIFTMKDAIITEFRGNLEVLFPQSIPENSLIQIKEVSWKQEDGFLTLWFRNQESTWVVVDAYYWNKEAEF